MKKIIKGVKARRAKIADRKAGNESQSVPRITNETVAEHREEVLGSARKFILPLQQSKHKVVLVSISLFIATLLAFFAYCTLALYRFQSSDAFLYRVTQVIPFPIARSGSNFVAYENYLFELRHYKYFYENQQELDFETEAGQRQLAEFKRRALDKVVNDAYVKQIAKDNNITVTDQEVEDEITVVRGQNRLGNNTEVIEETLKKFWGWSIDDFKRSLRQQLLAQKVVATLDTDTNQRAAAAITELNAGADFAEVTQKYSDDAATKENGGSLGDFIEKNTRDLSPQTTKALFELEEGEYSEPFNIGYALEIVKATERRDEQVKAAHILFNFKNLETFINDRKAEQPSRIYISLPELEDIKAPETEIEAVQQ